MAEPTIRLAAKEDVPEILSMIKELAGFENAADSVHATEESLLKTLSFAPSRQQDSTTATSASTPSQPGYAKTFLLLTPQNEVAAMALYFHNYSTWRAAPGIYLEDLFVKPHFRTRGYATLLLRELAKEVQRIGGGRLEWSCLKWNENALRFYEGLGAVQMEEWVGLRVDGDNLVKLSKRVVNAKE
ncbi:acetyltransferase [Tothia fuscella]|uniref:Acetyltransferase n=1 Tax=Tothia fuscella TaxID=1048955 RepID=A0A9P4NQZ2_9PEZI|nr:acetyltransferase [Tothia fuscella]